ncbi:MAG: lytic transglycosylase domain-containing protein, partial [Proteobacteria bacterium]|nr:lytic transglycosylase domain-containing protein [Pseudomonadota bacterium]
QGRVNDLQVAGDALRRLRTRCRRDRTGHGGVWARLVAADTWHRLKRHEQALALLSRIRSSGHLLAAYVTWFTARQYLALGRPAPALRLLGTLAPGLRRAGHPLARIAAWDLARAQALTGQYAAATGTLERLAARVPKGPRRWRIHLARAEVLLKAGRTGEAKRVLLAVYARAPLSRAGRGAARRLGVKFRIGRRRLFDALGPADRVWFVTALTGSRSRRIRRRAGRLFGSIIPQPDWDARTKRGYKYLLARDHYARGRHTRALSLYGRLYRGETDPDQRVLALAGAFRSAVRVDAKTARRLLETMLDQKCNHSACVGALTFLARSHARGGRLDHAHRAYVLAARLAPDHDRGHRALWYAAKMWFEAGRLDKAARTYLRLASLARHSRFRSGALFHAGRMYRRLGKRNLARACYAQAAAEFPEDYYGQQARRRIGRLAGAGRGALVAAARRSPVKFLPPPVFPGTEPAALKNDPGWRRLRLLCRLDLTRWCRLEMEALLQRHPRQKGIVYHLMKSYHRRGRHRRAFFLLVGHLNDFKFGRGRKVPADWHELIYPRKYQAWILTTARKYGLNPYFLMGVGLNESRFVPLATSPVGARGLFQIMPFLGRRLARKLGLGTFHRAMLYVDRLNLEMAAYHLRELHQAYQGRPHLMAAAYNAGRGAVNRWLSRLGTRDLVRFVEGIGYLETRIFVKNVLQAGAVYAARAGRRYSARRTRARLETGRPGRWRREGSGTSY